MSEFLPLLAILVPLGGALALLASGRTIGARLAPAVTAIVAVASVAVSGLIAWELLRSGAAITGDAVALALGDRRVPFVLSLRADGLSAAMTLTVSLVLSAIAIFAGEPRSTAADGRPIRHGRSFWALLLGVWAALNAVFLGNDLFGIYIAIEALTLCAVSMACLGGAPSMLRAALRYLLFATLGSTLYLLGIALLHGAYGTLSITAIAAQIARGDGPAGAVDPALVAAMALMTAGMLAKAGLFPLHLWLPGVHANAAASVSAVHSALVVKASFFVLLRLWLDLMRTLPTEIPSQLVATLGGLAIVVGSVIALRQERLKVLIAWSTVAQIGYLFVLFPLAIVAGGVGAGSSQEPISAGSAAGAATAAITGAMLQAIAHAFAKAAMFLAAGLIADRLGHDRIDRLHGIGHAMPIAVIAFAIGGASLMGLPPSGGFWAKWLLLTTSVVSGQWWWGLVMFVGGLLAAGYVYRVLASALSPTDDPMHALPSRPGAAPSSRGQAVALALALVSLLLGLMAAAPPELVMIGRIPAVEASVP